jgi:hypothetical protein
VVLASRAHSFSDRLAEAGVIIAGGTLLLALIAAVVAVMAYAAATGLPDLRLQVRFPFSKANRPSFDVTEEYQLVSARDFMQTTATVQLRNDSGFSARNPAVIVRLDNAYSDGDPAKIRNAGWVIVGFASTAGITAIQWDGGPTYSVHGNSVRQLPFLALQKFSHPASQGPPRLTFELLADGYRRVVHMPVDLVVDGRSLYPQPEGEAPGWL